MLEERKRYENFAAKRVSGGFLLEMAIW